jgi:hypothetical protein
MLEAAYKAGYGKLLDLLQSEKWFALMKLGAKSKTQYTQPSRSRAQQKYLTSHFPWK